MKKVLTLLLVFTLGLTLASCTNEEDVANAQDAAQKLSIDVSDPMQVTDNFELLTEGLHESTITWKSNNTDVIANDGTVTRPAIGEEDATVTLTATVTVGKQKVEKEFTLKVLASVPSLAVTIAELESDAVADGDVVEITGIVVGRIQGKGFYVVDSTGGAYVYQGSNPEGVSIGDEVTVLGERSTYFNTHQVSDVQKLTINSSDNTIPAHAEKTIRDLYYEDPVNTTLYGDLISFDGYVTIMGSNNSAYIVWYSNMLELDKLEVYYKSGMLAAGAAPYDSPEMTDLKALEGKHINATALFMDNYSGMFRVTIDTPSTFTEKTLTDQDKAYLAVAFESDYISAQGDKLYNSLTLGETSEYVDGATLSWTTSDENIIAADGTTTHVVGSDQNASITVTATVGDATATKNYPVVVVDKVKTDGVSVEDALALENGTWTVVKGIVSALRDNGKPFIQDSEGNAMYIYTELDVNVGDEIKVKGKIGTYTGNNNNMKQIQDAELIEVVSTGNALVVDTTTTASEITDAITDFHSVLFEMTLVYEETAYGYYNFVGNGSKTIVMNSEYFPTLLDYVDETTNEIKVMFAVRDVYYGDARIVPVGFADLTNAENLALAQAYIDVAGETSSDLNLITQVPWFDATITWTSTNTAVDPATGEVTRPENGNGNATGDLVAAVTIGEDDAVDTTFAVVVKEQLPPSTPDLMFSEYIEGGSYNKAIELYNPTDSAIDLSNYTINVYMNGDTEPTKSLTLSGTLAAGEVYVICNSGIVETTKPNCDLEDNNIANFNGDDVLEITKNGDRVDMFGVIGADSNYAKDHTYRRVTTIDKPNRVYTTSEWEELAKDTLDGLGTHTHTAS